MNRNCLPTVLVAALVFAGLLSAPRARATAYAYSDLSFNNLLIYPVSGTLQFTYDWDVQAYAQAGGNTGLATGTATTVSTNKSDPFSLAYAQAVSSYPPTTAVSAHGDSIVAIPDATAALDTATGDGTLDGMFCITGGVGVVNTTFSVDDSGLLSVLTDQYGASAVADAIFTLQIDGTTVLSDYKIISVGPNDSLTLNISDALSNTVPLQFDKDYWIHLEVDAETKCINTPEPSVCALLAAGLAGLACLRSARRIRPTQRFPKGRRLGGALLLLSAAAFLPLAALARPIGGKPPHCCLYGNVEHKGLPNTEAPAGCPKHDAIADGGISLSEGNLIEDDSIATVRNASGITLDFSLTYNSCNADASAAYVNTVTGFGWTHTYNIFLFAQGGSMFVMDGVGQVVKFQAGARWTYTVSPGYFEKLVRNPDGTFTMTSPNMTVFQFAYITNTPFLVQGQVYRLTSITDRNQNTSTLSYSNGNLFAITDAYGRSLTFGYNAQSKLQSVTDPLGRTTTLQYDAGGSQLLRITDPAGKFTQYTYNFMNQLTDKTDKDGRTYSYLYSNFMPVSIVDGAGQPFFSLSNSANWAVNETNLALNMMVAYLPATTTETDGRGNTWLYDYDTNGYITQITAPDLSTTTYNYDPVTLRVASKTDANGGVTSYKYDANGNVTNMTDALGNITSYTYDPVFNQMTSMTDPNGYVTTWQYDTNGNRIQETDAMGYTRSWTYDAHGNVLSETDKNGNVTYHYYDQFGNCTNTTDTLGNVTSFTYDGVGNLLSRTDANHHVITNAYDALDRLISVTTGLCDAPPLLSPPAMTPVTLNVSTPPSGGVLLQWDGSGMILTTATNLAGPFEDVLVDGVQVTNSPFLVSGPLTNVCQFYRLRPAAGLLPQTGGLQLDPLNDDSPPTPSVTLYTYDAEGHTTSLTDANGNTTWYAYDVRGRLIATTNALGFITANTYDATDNKISSTDANGNTTWRAYDAQNRLAYATNALGYVTAFAYDPAGNQIAATDANGNTTTFTYDLLNRQVAITNALGYVTQYGYDAPTGGGGCGCGAGTTGTSHIIEQTDADGKVTYFKYDPLGRLLKTVRKQGDTADVIGPNDAVTSFTYDPNGNRLAVVDPNGITNFFAYDALNRAVAATDGAGDVTLTTYDPAGNILTTIAPNGNVTTNAYDSLNRLIQVDDLIGRVASFTYDGVGNRLSVTDSNTNTTQFAYDPLNRLVTTTDPMGNTSTNVYDPVGNLVQAIDRNGNSTLYTYDPLNRRTNRVDALGCAIASTYDGVGNLLAITDANNHTTSYQYDALNRKVRETYPDSTSDTRTYTYDPVGNVTSRTDQKGNTTLYFYSDLYYLTNRIYANDPSDRFTYDLAGRMLTASKTNWLTTNDWVVTFAYDGAGRVTNTTQGGCTIAYAYNIPGRTRSLTYPSGTNIVELTDARGRLLTVSGGGATPIAAYAYDLGNRVLTRTYPNGVVAQYAYNLNNWITSLLHTNPAATNLIAGFTYAYNKEGNKFYEQNLWNANRSEAYSYDPIYRLTNWLTGQLVNGTVPAPTNSEQWQLDCLGNWNAWITNGVTQNRTHNAVNELTSINATNLTYDPNGNLTNDGTYTYTYDEENRLLSVSSVTSLVAQYSSDALGRRVQKTANPVGIPTTTRYFHDDKRIIEEQDALGVTQATYTYGNYIDEALTMDRAGQTYYYHPNALFSVEALTDATGTSVERYAYDAYGNATVTDGNGSPVLPNAWGTPHSVTGNPYLFTGRQLDEETGLYFYRARYYDSPQGRFLQRDPYGYTDAMNLYQYVQSRPTRDADPSGRFTFEVVYHDVAVGTPDNPNTYEIKMKITDPCCCLKANIIQIVRYNYWGWWSNWKIDDGSATSGSDPSRDAPFYTSDSPFTEGQTTISMTDRPGPSYFPQGREDFQFQVCAICRKGKNAGVVYGCAKWSAETYFNRLANSYTYGAASAPTTDWISLVIAATPLPHFIATANPADAPCPAKH